MCRCLLLMLVLLASGCAGPRAFVPVESAAAVSPTGRDIAAEYQLGAPEHVLGAVRIWSGGVSQQDLAGETQTLVHVGFLVLNLGDSPIELDPKSLLLLEVLLENGTSYRVPVLRVQGETRVAPGYRQELEASFSLPGQPAPDSVHAYRVAWRIRNGAAYAAQTTFVPAPELRRTRRPARRYHGHYYFWVYPWPYYGYWPYYYGWPYHYGSAPYPMPYEQWRYWRHSPPFPLPPPYLEPRHH